MTRSQRTCTLAAAVVALTVAVAGIAWATQARGFHPTLLSRGAMGPVDSRSEATNADGSHWESEIKIGSPSQVNTVYVLLDPGGTPGWHYHLGPTIITIKSGVGTFYQGDDLTHAPHRVGAGESFVEEGGDVHFLRNESTVPLEVVFTQIAPVGAPGSVSVPRPDHYPEGFE